MWSCVFALLFLFCSTEQLVEGRIRRPSSFHKLRAREGRRDQDVINRSSTAQGLRAFKTLRQLDSKSKGSKSTGKSKSTKSTCKSTSKSKSKSRSKSKSAKGSEDDDCDETQAPTESPTVSSTSTLAPTIASSTSTETLSPTLSIDATTSPTGGEGGIGITTVPPKNLTFPPTTPPTLSNNDSNITPTEGADNPGGGLLPATGGATFSPSETRPPATGNDANRTSLEGATNPGAIVDPVITTPLPTSVPAASNTTGASGGTATRAPASTLAPSTNNGTVAQGIQTPVSGAFASSNETISQVGNATPAPITVPPTVGNATTTVPRTVTPAPGGNATAAPAATQAPPAGTNTTASSSNVTTPAPRAGVNTATTPSTSVGPAPASNFTTAPLGANETSNNTPLIQTESNPPASAVRNGNFGVALVEAKNLSFAAELEISFFEGEGKAPTDEEIDALIHETKLFFTDLFSTASTTTDAFQSFHVSNLEPTYNKAEDADYFKASFDATLVIAPGSSVTMDTVSNLVDNADYGDFISGYIWMSAPFQRNEFYQTHRVTFTCHALGVETERRLMHWRR